MGNNRGIALILVLWIMAALILLAAGLSVMAHTESQIARNFADTVQCKNAARSGIYAAIADIEEQISEPIYLGEDEYTVDSETLGIDFGGPVFSARVEDEAGKLNINAASAESLSTLFSSSEIADCIIDWRDEDGTPGAEGAETDYYSSLTTPYECKNAKFDTVRELLLVKGVTEDLLANTDNDNIPLIDMLTVYDQEETAPEGQTVDIQSADKQTLTNAIGNVLTSQEIDAIIDYRSRSAFKSKSEIVRVSGISREKIAEIYDSISVSGEEATTGKVNINTAPASVIAARTGIDLDAAEDIVEHRSSEGAFASVGQLLLVSSITPDSFVTAAPALTVRSKVFRIVSTGSIPDRKLSVTITCVVEIEDGKPVSIRYWQE